MAHTPDREARGSGTLVLSKVDAPKMRDFARFGETPPDVTHEYFLRRTPRRSTQIVVASQAIIPALDNTPGSSSEVFVTPPADVGVDSSSEKEPFLTANCKLGELREFDSLEGKGSYMGSSSNSGIKNEVQAVQIPNAIADGGTQAASENEIQEVPIPSAAVATHTTRGRGIGTRLYQKATVSSQRRQEEQKEQTFKQHRALAATATAGASRTGRQMSGTTRPLRSNQAKSAAVSTSSQRDNLATRLERTLRTNTTRSQPPQKYVSTAEAVNNYWTAPNPRFMTQPKVPPPPKQKAKVTAPTRRKPRNPASAPKEKSPVLRQRKICEELETALRGSPLKRLGRGQMELPTEETRR